MEKIIEDAKQRIEYSKNNHIRKLLLDRIETLVDDIVILVLSTSITWEEAIKEIDKITFWISPEEEGVVREIRGLVKNKIMKTALSKNIANIFEGGN